MKKFEIGKTYSMRSICDNDCIWTYKVIARTAQTITIQDISTDFRTNKKPQKCKIIKKVSEYRDAESLFPLGNYSMAPTLSADHIA